MALAVPPGAANHAEDFQFTFRKNATVLSFMPHMHLRGVSAKYVATYPDGRTETLLSVPDYDFNWQSVYRFRKPLEIPKGTKLTWSGTGTTRPTIRATPTRRKRSRWGLQTWDEMQNGWMEVVWE